MPSVPNQPPRSKAQREREERIAAVTASLTDEQREALLPVLIANVKLLAACWQSLFPDSRLPSYEQMNKAMERLGLTYGDVFTWATNGQQPREVVAASREIIKLLVKKVTPVREGRGKYRAEIEWDERAAVAQALGAQQRAIDEIDAAAPPEVRARGERKDAGDGS